MKNKELKILLSAPRGFCAGVERAIEIVEKSIQNSGLGINPVTEGTLLRLPLPELNEERRKEISKMAAQFAEHARISVRNVRKDGMDKIKRLKSDG